jgi:hypothetical protein
MGRTTRLQVESLDDRSVPATLSVGDVTLMEGTSGVQYAAVPVTLTEPLNKTFTVSYKTMDSTAVAGSDYKAVKRLADLRRGRDGKDDPRPGLRRPGARI